MTAATNPQARGICAHCEFEGAVMRNGLPRPHNTRRIRPDHRGRPEIYVAKENCLGNGMPAEPIPVTPVAQVPVFQAPERNAA